VIVFGERGESRIFEDISDGKREDLRLDEIFLSNSVSLEEGVGSSFKHDYLQILPEI